MSSNSLSIGDLQANISTALTSDGSIVNCQPLCAVIESLAISKDENVADDLGQSFATGLLRFFLNSAHGSLLRRWAGILLSELCQISRRTASHLSRTGATANLELKGLGRLVLGDENEDLRIVSCLIMKQLYAQDVDQDLFWPSQAPPVTFAVADSQEWMSHLQDILDIVSGPRRSHADVLYPCIFDAGNDWYFDNQDARIAALVEDQLTIIVPPPAAAHIFLVDIPFDNIRGATLQPNSKILLSLNSNSQSSAYTVNAIPFYNKEVILAFGDDQEAEEALTAVKSRCRVTTLSTPLTSSKPVRSSSPPLALDGSKDSEDLEAKPTGPFDGEAAEPSRVHPVVTNNGQVVSPSRSAEPGKHGPESLQNTATNSEGNASQVTSSSQRDQTKLSGNDTSIYDFADESPGPSTPAEEPKKIKRKAETRVVRPKKSQTQVTAPHARRGQGTGRKRKDENADSDMDEDYRPPQQKKATHKSSGRITRASATRKSGIQGSRQHTPVEPTVFEQQKESSPVPQLPSKESKNLLHAEDSPQKDQNERNLRHQRRPQAEPSPVHILDSVPEKKTTAKQRVGEESNKEYEGNFIIPQDEEYSSDTHMFKSSRRSNNKLPSDQDDLSSKPGNCQENAMILSSSESSDSSMSEKEEVEKPKSRGERTHTDTPKETVKSVTALVSKSYTKLDENFVSSKRAKREALPEENKRETNAAGTLAQRVRKQGDTSTGTFVESSVSKRNQQLDEFVSRKPQIASFGPRGPQNQGRRPAQSTPAPLTQYQPAYSSSKSKKRKEPDTFGSLIEFEEKFQPTESVLPQKPLAELSNPAKGEKSRQRSSAKKYEEQQNDHASSSGQAPGGNEEDAGAATHGEASSPSGAGLCGGSNDGFAPLNDHASPSHSELKSVQLSPKTFDIESAPGSYAFARLPYVSKPQSPPAVSFQHPTVQSAPANPAKEQIRSIFQPKGQPNGAQMEINMMPSPTQVKQGQRSFPKAIVPRLHGYWVRQDHPETLIGETVDSPGAQKVYRHTEIQSKSVISSNRKKIPEPPEADSNVITTHVPAEMLKESESLQTPAHPPVDPFQGATPITNPSKDETRFLRKLRKDMEKQAKPSDLIPQGTLFGQEADAEEDDPDRTLVEMINDIMDVDSSEDISTPEDSANAEAEFEECTEEMDWEASLKPHQRDILDVLTRISRHFVRHLIDAEAAIEDIISDYDADGMHLIEQIEECHRKEYELQRRNLTEVRTRMSNAFMRLNNQIASGEKHVRSSILGKNWENPSASTKQISQLETLLDQVGGA